MHKAALSLERNIVDRVTNTDNTAPEARVEKMFEYGYRKSNYGPDELVTDAHDATTWNHAVRELGAHRYSSGAHRPCTRPRCRLSAISWTA